MAAILGCCILHCEKGVPRIGRRVEASKKRKISERKIDPVQAPARKMVASRTGADVREMHHDVKAFVAAIQIPLISPHLETFASDPFDERGKGRKHVKLR